MVISASFGGEQLYRRRFNIERGQELRETHATRLALFPAYQGEVSTLASCTSENLIRERVFSVKTLQWPRIRLMDAIKMMGCSARGCAGGKAEQSYFQGMMSVNGAILVRFRSLDVTLLVTNEGNGGGGYARRQRRDEIPRTIVKLASRLVTSLYMIIDFAG